MSLSVCAITGQPLRHPVASRITGHLFEQEIITKHLGAFPYCPITNKPMTLEDLIVIKRSWRFIKSSKICIIGQSSRPWHIWASLNKSITCW